MTNKCRYFLETDFVGVNRLLVLIYWNQDEFIEIKMIYWNQAINLEGIIYQKVLLRIITSSIEKTLMTN